MLNIIKMTQHSTKHRRLHTLNHRNLDTNSFKNIVNVHKNTLKHNHILSFFLKSVPGEICHGNAWVLTNTLALQSKWSTFHGAWPWRLHKFQEVPQWVAHMCEE